MSKTIYTIDSRDNTMLEVMKQYFNISDLQMSKEINNMHDILVELLEKKGISYSVLYNPQNETFRHSRTSRLFS